jgi:MFS family permease
MRKIAMEPSPVSNPASNQPDAMMPARPAGGGYLRIVAICFFAWIFDFYDLILYSFLLVPIARELHLSAAQSSLALGTSFLMTAAGGVIFGFAGDRWGRRPTIAATVAIYGIGTLLCAGSNSLWELILFRSITGLGMGGGWAPGQSLIAESVPPERRARYAAYVQTGAPLGILFAAAASGYLTPIVGWRLTFAISAIPALVIFAAVLRWLPESGVWIRSRAGTRFRWRELGVLRPYRNMVALLFVILLLNSEAYWFTYSWMPGYLELHRGLSALAASQLMIEMQYGGVLGYFVFGILADRYGRRPMFFLFGLVMAVGLLPETIFWDRAAAIPGLIACAMFTAGFGTGIWSGMAPMISELLPTRVRNTTLGLLLNVTRGFQFFTPLAITFLSTRVGFGPTLAIGAIFSTTAAAMIWLLPETRGRDITALDAE